MTERRKDSGLRVSRPDHVDEPLWLVGLSMAADTNYPSQDCREFGTVWLEFTISPTSDPAGVLFIEWSFTADGVYYPFAFDPGKFSKVDLSGDLAVVEGDGTVTVADPALVTSFALGVEKPPPFLRGRWDSTSGGSATGMSGQSFGRG